MAYEMNSGHASHSFFEGRSCCERGGTLTGLPLRPARETAGRPPMTGTFGFLIIDSCLLGSAASCFLGPVSFSFLVSPPCSLLLLPPTSPAGFALRPWPGYTMPLCFWSRCPLLPSFCLFRCLIKVSLYVSNVIFFLSTALWAGPEPSAGFALPFPDPALGGPFVLGLGLVVGWVELPLTLLMNPPRPPPSLVMGPPSLCNLLAALSAFICPALISAAVSGRLLHNPPRPWSRLDTPWCVEGM
mmetsp:Transcript_30436/g.73413  ORF Transcript_30436/g.73413 Transcript_30436/m.73413 type:complete len:243 (-) Transcript_30436:200-928(-)